MDSDQAKRYKEKSNLISKRSDQIGSWIQNLSPLDFMEDDKTKLASYKAFQEIVEALMDVLAMICKDSGLVPKDDYTNIDNLDIFDIDGKIVLIEANKLKNKLVYDYYDLDDLMAFEDVKYLLPRIKNLSEEIEQWIKTKLLLKSDRKSATPS